MLASSSLAPSPNRSARSDTDCVTDSTLICSSYVKKWFCLREGAGASSSSGSNSFVSAPRSRPPRGRTKEAKRADAPGP